ncbi:MAG TPA: NRDE family protein [Casimicrobiaceae bacterium]|nr:NRDE family protein [Casimicrobiaceae bacterium]
MCLVVVALRAHPAYTLVLAANRDEFHARPAAAAEWGRDGAFAGILAGRDLFAGGTWLGVRRDGRFALVTNVRDGKPQDPAARSRGELVPRVLDASGIDAAFAAIATDGARYNGFNLLAGDTSGAAWMSNRSAATRRITGGTHGLSNALLDVPWPKIVRTEARLQAWAARADADVAPLFAALADREPAPDQELPSTGVTLERERLLSSPFIVSETYGTRCSTVFTVDRVGRARFHERSFAPDGGATGDAIETWTLAR